MTEKITPYPWDLSLFGSLGLEPFEANLREETYIGEVKVRGNPIKLWVTCLPAHFFRAEIVCENGDVLNLLTGSGNFTDYWPKFKAFAEGTLVIHSIVKKETP